MGRLHHLEQTLPINIMNSSTYKEKEFVILNYNSKDALHHWAKNNLRELEKRGTIKYYRTLIPQKFSATHAKNIAYKKANGDIICNLDADNFIMPGFCEYLCELFKEPNVLFGSTSLDVCGSHGCCGKIATLKKHFYSVNGYDEEQHLGWGWEDVSLRYRIEKQNNLKTIYGDVKWNRVINHTNEERVKNFELKNLKETQRWSEERLYKLSVRDEYIVNKNKNWGFIEDLKEGLD
jgi:glycosyltransferase involved in cell wall biosynthesis